MRIERNSLDSAEVQKFVLRHLEDMHAVTPAESVYALGIESLQADDVCFWIVRDDEDLLGCGALRDLGEGHAEIKSMRTDARHLRKGVATHLLEHILQYARQNGFQRISLETGISEHFAAAQAFYYAHGFEECGPFGKYEFDPHSLYLTREL